MILSSPRKARSGPFTHSQASVRQKMTTVLLALAPALFFDLWLFGLPAIMLFALTVASCVAFEALCLHLADQPVAPALGDGSAVLTGCLLAMSLPPWAPWWIGVLGALVAVPLAKHAYGGIGRNLFNPAMVARVALLVSFPVVMTAWVAPQPLFSAGAPGFADALAIFAGHTSLDAVSSATPLGFVKTELSRGIGVSQSVAQVPGLSDLLFGMRPGSLGETSALLILAGGLLLLWRRIISWHIPVAVLGTLFAVATIANGFAPERFASGSFHLFCGASFLGAFFIATDYVTSPVSKLGQIVFGVGVGLLAWVIRSFAGYPEGMAFAVLLMNSLTPIIDQYTRPRILGRDRRGAPIEIRKEGAR
jgi:electron transport complex protein RnfD